MMHDTDDFHDMLEAGTELLNATMQISRRHGVCAVCLLQTATESTLRAVACNAMRHGVPGVDYNMALETIQ
jgi:hypothetical protein